MTDIWTHAPRTLDTTFGPTARDRRPETRDRGDAGAIAALETFYFAFHARSLEALLGVWAPSELVTLKNPVGGVVRGFEGIRRVYERILAGTARVRVELHDVVADTSPEAAIFSGRERGTLEKGDLRLELAIRTSRVFRFLGADLGWRQVHHHGSIDDPVLLERYQRALHS